MARSRSLRELTRKEAPMGKPQPQFGPQSSNLPPVSSGVGPQSPGTLAGGIVGGLSYGIIGGGARDAPADAAKTPGALQTPDEGGTTPAPSTPGKVAPVREGFAAVGYPEGVPAGAKQAAKVSIKRPKAPKHKLNPLVRFIMGGQ